MYQLLEQVQFEVLKRELCYMLYLKGNTAAYKIMDRLPQWLLNKHVRTIQTTQQMQTKQK